MWRIDLLGVLFLAACTNGPERPQCTPTELEPLVVLSGDEPVTLSDPWRHGSRESLSYGSSVALARGFLIAGIPFPGYGQGRVGVGSKGVGGGGTGWGPPGSLWDAGFGASLTVVGDVSGWYWTDVVIGYAIPRLDILDVPYRDVIYEDGPKYHHFVERTGDRPLRAARCGDLDDDGRADLCTTGGVWRGPIGAGPPPRVSWPIATAIAAGDLAKDGVPDLLLGDGDRVWWVRDPLAWWGPASSLDSIAEAAFDVDGPVTALQVEDLDGDCTPEVIVGTTTTTLVGHLGRDGFVELTRVDGAVDALVGGDFDGDGVRDLVIGGDAEVRWLRGAGTPPEVRVFRSEQWPDDRLGASLASADVDGDGRWELAIGAPDTVVRERDYEYGSLDWVESVGGAVWWFEGLPLSE